MLVSHNARETLVQACKASKRFSEFIRDKSVRGKFTNQLTKKRRLSNGELLSSTVTFCSQKFEGLNSFSQRCHYTTWKRAKLKSADKPLPKQKEDSGSLIAKIIANKQMSVTQEVNSQLSVPELIKKYEAVQKEFNALYQEDVALRSEETEQRDLNDVEPSLYFLEELKLDKQEEHLPKSGRNGIRIIYGSADPTVPFSNVSCGGCGAKLHCQNTAIPGYLPKEKFVALTEKQLKRAICQKCFLITYHHFCLNVRASPDEYQQLVSSLRNRKGLIAVVVDMTDITNSFIQNLPQLVGRSRQYFIIGNKIDLLSGMMDNLNHCKDVLFDWCEKSGLNRNGSEIKHLCLVSAKTGYGIEQLVNSLLYKFDHAHKGDVFLLGSTNSGKSTLFNALLSSDYCKHHVRDVIHQATVSRWPGTTIDLLKFPIITPTGQRLKIRTERLIKEERERVKREKEMIKKSRNPGLFKSAPLTGSIGQTDFRSEHVRQEEDTERELSHEDLIVPPSYTYTPEGDVSVGSRTKQDLRRETVAERKQHELIEENLERLTKSKWLLDTPGLVNSNQVINLLSPEELSVVLPAQTILPRTFVLKPGQVMFVSGLGRIDYFQGPISIYFTVIAGKRVPVRVIDPQTTDPDKYYEETLGSKLLGVPLGDADRLMKIPALIGQEFHVTGLGWKQSVADIVLSSIGFVSITAGVNVPVGVRAYTPGGRGCRLHAPALLPTAVNLRGQRVTGTAAYRVRKKKTNVVTDKST